MDTAPADQTAVEAMWASYVADSGYGGPLVTAFANLFHAAGVNRSTGPGRSLVSRTRTRPVPACAPISMQLPPLPPL